MTINHKDFS